MKNQYRSEISQAKNLGSSGGAAKHWFHQRFSAIILIFSSLWFCFFIWSIKKAGFESAIFIIGKPYNISMILLFVFTGLYHGAIGMQVVIEDYISTRWLHVSLILSVQIFSIVTAISFFVALINIMILQWNL